MNVSDKECEEFFLTFAEQILESMAFDTIDVLRFNKEVRERVKMKPIQKMVIQMYSENISSKQAWDRLSKEVREGLIKEFKGE